MCGTVQLYLNEYIAHEFQCKNSSFTISSKYVMYTDTKESICIHCHIKHHHIATFPFWTLVCTEDDMAPWTYCTQEANLYQPLSDY